MKHETTTQPFPGSNEHLAHACCTCGWSGPARDLGTDRGRVLVSIDRARGDAARVEEARQNYEAGIGLSPGRVDDDS